MNLTTESQKTQRKYDYAGKIGLRVSGWGYRMAGMDGISEIYKLEDDNEIITKKQKRPELEKGKNSANAM